MRLCLTTSIAALTFATTVCADPARYELDPSHTSVFFTVHHIGFADTLGIFGDVNGSFTYDYDTQELSDVTVTIKSASVTTFDDARDAHVKNKDFLNVGAFPEITFTADEGQAQDANSGTVSGDLTILGVTQPVELDVVLNKAAEYPFGHKRFTLGLSLAATVKRSAFGMSYAVENGLVGDDVDIRIETEALQME